MGVLSSPNIFRNELFQIGGYRLLRGFDEESIFATQYGVGTVEYRFLSGLNSYFFAFADIGWVEIYIKELIFQTSLLGWEPDWFLKQKRGY
jgi:hemolysin activation/secretion protein